MRRGFLGLIPLAMILAASSAPAASATLYSGAAATRPEIVLNVSGTRVTVDNVQLACGKSGAFTAFVAFGRLTKGRFSFKIGDTFVPEPLGGTPSYSIRSWRSPVLSAAPQLRPQQSSQIAVGERETSRESTAGGQCRRPPRGGAESSERARLQAPLS